MYWHVLNVAPKAEQKAGALLARLGYTTCVPVQKQLHYWSDRKKWMNVVLFPSYVFVETSPQLRSGVFAVPYVHKYLKAGDEIATLREAEMALVRRLGTVESPVQITHSGFYSGERLGYEMAIDSSAFHDHRDRPG